MHSKKLILLGKLEAILEYEHTTKTPIIIVKLSHYTNTATAKIEKKCGN